MDEIEEALQLFPPVKFIYRHFFYPGTYCREMWVPADAIVTSKIHNTEHQFTLSAGQMTVMTEDGGEITLEAPFIGTTKVGTRRVAKFHSESVWTTVHKIDWIIGDEGKDEKLLLETLRRIEDEIIEKYDNPLLNGEFKNLIQ